MANFYLVRRAFLDIQEIYDYSFERWGESTADQYIDNLYKTFEKISKTPELGDLRKSRSIPFLMFPAEKHYVVYEPFQDGIILITLLHQVRDIENIIQEFGSGFYDEISLLKNEMLKNKF